MTFSQKLLSAQISLASGSFGSSGGNSRSLTGLRMSARMEGNGGAAQWSCDLAVWGMLLSDMNQLSTIGTQANQLRKNTITLQAGDADSGMSTVFMGAIRYAWVDAQAMPEVCFRVQATSTTNLNVTPTQPTSIQGAGDAFTMLQGLASQAGLTFQSSGTSVKLASPYLPGTIGSQIRKICEHANLEWDVNNGVLAVCPQGTSRNNGPTLVSPQTGMVGYPMFQQSTVIVKTLYNPSIVRLGTIQIESDLTPACGTWQVNKLTYELDAITPHGKWFQTMVCNLVGTQGQGN